ncbi:MAG: hypothetical protein HZRFUVUK_001686 [Candidatus Fervidibacterota bacterium]
MCLAVPMRVVAVNGNEVEVEQGGTKLRVRVDLVEDVRVGDYVLVHAGFAIQKLDEEEAFETLRLLEMLGMSPLDDGTSMSNVE